LRYAFIREQAAAFAIRRLCEVLQVSRSGYYAWRSRPMSRRQRANARLVEHMRRLHLQTKERYGAVKLWRALRALGVACGRHRVARLRRQHGLMARRVRRFRLVLERHQFAPPARNHVQQVFTAPAPNGSGPEISPRLRRARAGCTWLCSWTCTRGGSSAGP
jgi:transposase InsO family protein